MNKTLARLCVVPALMMAATLSHAADKGTEVYNANCAMCHVPGLANAPKFGDKAAWEPRMAAGKAALLKSALAGKGAMPAKGGNPKLTEEEVGAALDHMLAALK
ncbi:cytochrome c5 [Sphaerotilus hippei]|uniref:Cytochrome c5 n=1 Tax=Sphaerotilus hippei TaxID=744406 RepID=A0A318GXG2_9BURK|nr:c-type cytochrome [Sphaerotilus hippei]PXW94197.1 cytochrome c5 [Sphaerotilus hippei]